MQMDGHWVGHVSGGVYEKSFSLRVRLKIPWGPVFAEKAAGRGATKENTRPGSSTAEQRSPAAFCAKTLRTAGLLPVVGVGSVVTARSGDASPSPP